MSKVIKSSNIEVSTSFNLMNNIVTGKQSSLPETESQAEHLLKSSQLKGADYFRSQTLEVMEQSKADAFRLVTEARTEAERIKNSAAEKLSRELAAARQRGYQDGLKKGISDTEEENRAVIDEIRQLLAAMMNRQKILLDQYKDSMYQLTLDVAGKIINRELDQNGETYLDLFSGAVKGLVNVEWIKLTVSGKEYGMACRNAEGLQSLVNGAKHIEISIDRDAPAGACLIETPQGIIDAGVETQLGKVNEMIDQIRIAERGEDSAF